MVLNPLDHPICLAHPNRLTSVVSWQEHIPFAMYLTDILRPEVFVELGTHSGDSYCAFCQAVVELKLTTHCFAVDTWKGDQHAGFYDASVLEDLRAHHDPLYGSFSTLIQSTFDDALAHFADNSISLLHIDGCHTYEAVKHDFYAWLPKVDPDGVVLFHDTNVRQRNFGISRFWDEIKKDRPHFEFLHSNGLGVLALGEVRAKELRWLFQAKEKDTVRIRQFFFELGHRLDRQIAAEEKPSAEEGQVYLPKEEPKKQNVLQLFWLRNGKYSEDNSLEELLSTTDEARRYVFRLPGIAQAPLRLDPSNRLASVEIYEMALYAAARDGEGERELLMKWSLENQFEGLTPGPGVMCVSKDITYQFICVDEDPQLYLHGLPERKDLREWILEMDIRVSANLKDLLEADLRRLNEEKDSLSMRVEEMRQGKAALQTELARSEQFRCDLQAQFASESEQMRQKESALNASLQALSENLETTRASEQRLFEELDQQKQQSTALQFAVAEKEKTLQGLTAELLQTVSQLQERDGQLQTTTSRLEEQGIVLRDRERELQRIYQSLGWRILSRYGRLKHRLLLPAYQRLRNAQEIIVKHNYAFALEPVNHLQTANNGEIWEATGSDPQFHLSGPLPKGWIEVAIHIETEGRSKGHARLYLDRGAGYNESDSLDLGETGREQRRYVQFGAEVNALRLDPLESSGRFRLKKLSFIRISASQAEQAKATRSNPPTQGGLLAFARFSLTRLKGFQKKNGRLPRLGDLPSATRRTLRAWNYAQPQLGQSSPETDSASSAYSPPAALDPYDAWLEVNEWNALREAVLQERLVAIANPVLLSVVMPVYNPPLEFLDKAIQSVVDQVYQNWELCIADDASTDPALRDILQKWSEQDSRIRLVWREENGNISRATNSAAEIASGEFLVLMDQDDEITPDALAEVALYLDEHSQTDILYSDDDKINAQGQRFAPQFKPDYSPELLLSYMYFSHLFVLRRELFFKAGALRVGFEGSQDYDLALRATELTDKVGHIPKVLYHWRVLPGSTALSGGEKPQSLQAGLNAVQEAMERRGMQAKMDLPDWALQANCGIFTPQFSDDGPRVAIIIPTKNNLQVLQSCLDSLEKTTYKNYEVLIIDNESDDRETLEYLQKTRHMVLRIPNPAGRFSFAYINNRAVEQADADYVLFLNNDTEVITANWLSQMVGYLGLTGVGAVGARLLFPDGRIQHAGIVHGYYNGMAGPAFKLLPAWDHGYLSYAMVARNYSAVTAACMLTRKDLFTEMGGFDEKNFAVAYNDVDYGYRLRDAGHRVVYCPTAELIHHEGYSRGFADNPVEPATFRKRYGGFKDPFYSPHLSLEHERFAIDAGTLAPESLPPIRALLCAFNLNWEGAPYSQFETTVRLKEQGIIDPIVYSPSDGALREAYEAQGIPVEVFTHPLAGVHGAEDYDSAIAGFAERIRDWRVEVVYGNTRQTFYAIDAARRLGLPSIWNPRESEDWQTYFDYLGQDIASRALECFRYPYKVVFVADATRESCRALNTHHNFMTIHNGLDRQKFASALQKWPRQQARQELKIAEEELAILLLGTVCERKGQIDLVEALGPLSEEVAGRVRCFIVGDRPSEYSERLKSMLKALPGAKQSRVKIVEETSETALYYSAADLFVCTSRLESYPRVILEAMAAGLPIITTPVFGIVEQVQENINALFYRPGDSEALAERLETLVKEPRLRQKLAHNSQPVLDTLTDYEAMVKAYGEVFREAWLSGRSR
jgi:glycosyltransferase involved in cell wall biosynthesis